MSIEIEKGIPLADPNRGALKYPLREMEVGDSFFIPFEPGVSAYKADSRIRQRISALNRTVSDQRTFRVRQASKDGVRGLRCWRVENQHAGKTIAFKEAA